MNFYVLEPVDGYFGTKWCYATKIEPVNLGPCDSCPMCGKPASLKRWLHPYRVKLSNAKPEKWGDFLWVGGTSLAVSARLKKKYEEHGLRGIESFEPIEVVRYGTRKTGDFPIPPPQYFLIYVPWGRASQDDQASGVTREHPEKITCQYCRVGVSGRKQPRIHIDPKSWSGDDIFRPRGAPVQEMVSQAFKDLVDIERFTNAWLIPAEKCGYDVNRKGLWYINEEGKF
jgi:hypothetical protein